MPKKDTIDEGTIVEDKSLIDPRNFDTPENATRRASAVNMKIAGASYTQIAEHLGYSTPATARRAVERGIAEAAASPDDQEKVRWLVDARLERLLSAVSPNAHRPGPQQLDFAAAVLRIIDRKMTLWHLGGTNVTITPSGERVREVVAHLTQLADHGADQEADIMAEEEIIDAQVEEIDA